ncbi:hypothetical protein ACFE04_004945 [Oxalis oulophora]
MEIISTTTNGLRRPKWQPPTPRIIQIPRLHRNRSSQTKATTPTKPMLQKDNNNNNNKLGALFHKERIFKVEEQRRERVEEENGSGDSLVMMVEELEKWKFQNEMLRAECNLLRMEKDIAVKKMERRRIVCLEKGFKFAVQSMLSGRKKICDGHNPSLVFEEEIQELIEKLEKLQKRSRVKQLDVKKCSNFDKKALSLQKHLEKFDRLDNDVCVKEIQEFAEATNDSFHFNESFVPISNGNNSNDQQSQLSTLSTELQILKKEQARDKTRAKASSVALPQDSPNEMEKRVLVCRVKENYQTNDYTRRKQMDILNDRRRKVHMCNALKRVPLGEIGNL